MACIGVQPRGCGTPLCRVLGDRVGRSQFWNAVNGVRWRVVVAALICYSPTAARAAEQLVMPYACEVRDGKIVLQPSSNTAYTIIGLHEQQQVTACAPRDPALCRTWMAHKFDVGCRGVPTSWLKVVGAIVESRHSRGYISDGRLHLRMWPRWALGQPPDCIDGSAQQHRARGRPLAAHCAPSYARSARGTVAMPIGFAPVSGSGAHFMRVAAVPGEPVADRTDPPPPVLAREAPKTVETAENQPAGSAEQTAGPREPSPIDVPTPAPVLDPQPMVSPPLPSATSAPVMAPPATENAPTGITPAPPPPAARDTAERNTAVPSAPVETGNASNNVKAVTGSPPDALPALPSLPAPGLVLEAPPATAPVRGPNAPSSSAPYSLPFGWATLALVLASLAVILLPRYIKTKREHAVEPQSALLQEAAEVVAALPEPDPSIIAACAAMIRSTTGMHAAVRGQVEQLDGPELQATLLQELAYIEERLRAQEAPQPASTRDWDDVRRALMAIVTDLEGIQQAVDEANAEPSWPLPQQSMPTTLHDAYGVLGVNAEASDTAIKKVVDGLRQSWHPDYARGERDRAQRERRIKSINVAWELIRRRRSRAA